MKKHMPAAVVAGCLLLQFFNIGIASNCFSLYLPYMRTELLFTDSQTSLVAAAKMLFSLLGLLFMKRVYTRFGVRKGMALSSLLFCAGLFFLSAARTFPTVILGLLPYGIGYAFANLYSATIVLNAWFKKRGGLALGLVSSGSGLAAFVGPTPISALLEKGGLHAAFFCVGLSALVSGLISYLLVRDDPSLVGAKAYGDSPDADEENERIERERFPGPAPGKFLFMCCVFLLSTLSMTGVAHFSVYFIERGYTPVTAAYAITGFGLSLIFVKPLYGWLVDRFGGFYINIVYYVIGAIGLLMALTVCRGSLPVLIFSTSLIGIGSALNANGLPTWCHELYPEDPYTMNSQAAVVNMVSAVICSTLPGIIKDRFGSYHISFVGITICFVLSGLILVRCYRIRMNRGQQGPLAHPDRP